VEYNHSTKSKVIANIEYAKHEYWIMKWRHPE